MAMKWRLAAGVVAVLSWVVPGSAEWFDDNFTEWRVSNVVWEKDSPSTTLPLIDYGNAYMCVGYDGHGTGYKTNVTNGYAWPSGVATFWVKDWGAGAVFGVKSVSGGLDLGFRNDVNNDHYATAYVNGTWNQDSSWQWPAYWDGTIASVAQVVWDNQVGTVTFRFYNNTSRTLVPGALPAAWQGEATYTFTPTNEPMYLFTYAYGGPFTYFEYVRAAPKPIAAAPVFVPGDRYISGPTQVTMSCPTAGAQMYYTLDGSTPTAGSTHYTGAVEVTTGKTLRAIAVAAGYKDSPVTSVSYVSGFDAPAIGAIKVDGDLSDWAASTPWSDSFVHWIGSMTSTTRTKFAWNDAADMLYVAIETNESADELGGHPVIGFGTALDQAAIYAVGGTQLAFDTIAGGPSVNIVNEIHEYKRLYPNDTSSYIDSGTAGVQAAYSYNGSKWTYEIAIPLWTNWAVGQMTTKTNVSPGDAIYVYSMMQNKLDGANGTDMTYNGNPGFAGPGGLEWAAKLRLQPRPACGGPLVDDPVVYYSFDNSANLGLDGSGHGYNAAAAQSPAGYDPTRVIAGVTGGCFAGAANFPKPDFVDPSYVFHNALLLPTISHADVPTSGFTLAAWVKPDLTDFAESQELFTACSSTNTSTPACHVELRSGYVWRLCLRGNNGVDIVDYRLPATVTSNRWVHFAGVYDQAAGKVTIYINGRELGSTTAINNIGMAADWDAGAKIGSTGDWGRQFVGTMDELYVFKRALAPVQIATLAGEEIIPGDANLDGRVTFEDFAALQNHYGQTGMNWAAGDFDDDGRVSFADFAVLQNNYSRVAGQIPAAESLADAAGLPCGLAGVLLLAAMGMGLLCLGNQE